MPTFDIRINERQRTLLLLCITAAAPTHRSLPKFAKEEIELLKGMLEDVEDSDTCFNDFTA